MSESEEQRKQLESPKRASVIMRRVFSSERIDHFLKFWELQLINKNCFTARSDREQIERIDVKKQE